MKKWREGHDADGVHVVWGLINDKIQANIKSCDAFCEIS